MKISRDAAAAAVFDISVELSVTDEMYT